MDAVIAVGWALDDFADESDVSHPALDARNLLMESLQRLHGRFGPTGTPLGAFAQVVVDVEVRPASVDLSIHNID